MPARFLYNSDSLTQACEWSPYTYSVVIKQQNKGGCLHLYGNLLITPIFGNLCGNYCACRTSINTGTAIAAYLRVN
ncbi:MAG: hypothetical protein FWG54_06685 [Bacteroidetes bacterium]|nr:hypothetical protein [Bacteroidota bacterium]